MENYFSELQTLDLYDAKAKRISLEEFSYDILDFIYNKLKDYTSHFIVDVTWCNLDFDESNVIGEYVSCEDAIYTRKYEGKVKIIGEVDSTTNRYYIVEVG